VPTITLLRHGQASFGAADYDDLSDLGRTQAAVAGAELARRRLRDPVVVCGTLRRQADTATIAMGEMGLSGDPVVDDRWDEYDHIGLVGAFVADSAEGTAQATALDDPRAFQRALDAALAAWVAADEPDGWRGFAEGAIAALTDLARSLEGRDAIVSTSGGVIAAIGSHLLGVAGEAVVPLNRVVVNGALTTLLVGRSGVSLVTFNDHAHLSGEASELRTYR
jgi:broad specificity phosphatase PhoE